MALVLTTPARAGAAGPRDATLGAPDATAFEARWRQTALDPAAAPPPADEPDGTEVLPPDATEPAWEFAVTPFLWALQLDGDLTVEGLDVTVDYGFEDIFDHLDFAGMLELQARNDRWILQLAGMYAKLSMSGGVDLSRNLSYQGRFLDLNLPIEVDTSVTADISLGIAQLYVGYEAVHAPLGEPTPDGEAASSPRSSAACCSARS